MFCDKNDSMIENLAIIFSQSDTVWSCIYEDSIDEDCHGCIDSIIDDVRERECYGAYSNGRITDPKVPVPLMSFNGKALTPSVREEAVKFYSDKFEACLKSIYPQLKNILKPLSLDCKQNSTTESLGLFHTNAGHNKGFDYYEADVQWKARVHADDDEDIPIRLLRNGAVSYINFAFVKKEEINEHINKLISNTSQILDDFLSLITEDVELLHSKFFNRKYGYVKTIIIGIDTDNPEYSVVEDAHTILSSEMETLLKHKQSALIDEILSKIKEQYLDSYRI